jgi:formylglycine-generating enzyme required for sulfatase activity
MPVNTTSLALVLVGGVAFAGCSKENHIDTGADGPDADVTCYVGELRCNPDTHVFETCRKDELGFETLPGASPCASEALCEQGIQLAPPACPAPACSPGVSRCFNGAAETCDTDLNAFSPNEDCGAEGLQCNPRTGQCISLAIDPTEVSRSAYEVFLLDTAWSSKTTPPPGCGFKDTGGGYDFTPLDWDSQVLHPDLPVTGVDWCDAFVYCAWKGQHLCGLVDGGMLLYDTFADPGLSEWHNACSSGGEFDYPYGDKYQSQSCNDAGKDKTGSVEGLFAVSGPQTQACVSPRSSYASMRNMLGNVAEWENACSRDATVLQAGAGAADSCRVRGGHGDTPTGDMASGCSVQPPDPVRRETRSPWIGFRCCG